MRKLPARFRQPIVGLCIMFVMLGAMPAVILMQRLPAGADFMAAWWQTLMQVAPIAIPLGIGSALLFNLLANFFIEKVQ